MHWKSLLSRLHDYGRLMRLDWPIGSLLLFWPTLWALWLSGRGQPDWRIAAIFMAGAVLMHSLGCVINDYADRDFDPHVARTRARPLAARRISTREALMLAAVLSVVAILLILPILTPLLILLTLIAAFLTLTYPFAKRLIAIPQAYLGVAFGFTFPMTYAAQQGHTPPECWLLLIGNVFWSVAYDSEYAMVDRNDDLKIGIKTSAITFGNYDVAAIMCCYTLAFVCFAWAGLRSGLGVPFLAGLLIASGLAIRHYFLIRAREGDACFRAFRGNGTVGAVIFGGIALDYLLRGIRPF